MSRVDKPTLKCDRCAYQTEDLSEMARFMTLSNSHMSGTEQWDLCPPCGAAFHLFLTLETKTQTESNASAVFFLGFGSASSNTSDVRSISYIRTAKDGGSTLQKTTIDNAVIYEDGDSKPYVEDWVKIGHNNGAFWPWDFTYRSGDIQHRFHIPKGSILENYEVTP